MEDLNSFSGYMPGGFYRQTEFLEPTSDQKRLITSIDSFLSETNFDIGRYLLLGKISSKSFKLAERLLCYGQSERARLPLALTKKYDDLMYEMYRPVYDKMRSLGYSIKITG